MKNRRYAGPVALFSALLMLVSSLFVMNSCTGGEPEESASPQTTETMPEETTDAETKPVAYIAEGLWEIALTRKFRYDTLTTCGASSHLQGICVDDKLEYMYFSYTDVLAKLDMKTGKVVATIGGFGKGSFGTPGGAHLGCIAYYNGRIYGSLEYKEPGKKFFVCSFDENAITGMNMDMKEMESGVDAVLLYEPTADFRDLLCDSTPDADGFAANGQLGGHKYGCSGIDGITFGTLPGSSDGKEYMLVSYGIYGDNEWLTSRYDIDYNIIMAYDPAKLTPDKLFRFTYERGLSLEYTEDEVLKAEYRLFVFTGNTRYGTQNLEFERDTGNLILATYPGKKTQYPSLSFYVVDGSIAPVKQILQAGQNAEIKNSAVKKKLTERAECYKVDGSYPEIDLLTLLKLDGGTTLEKTFGDTGIFATISGREMPANATTGIVSLGNGYWYIADGSTSCSLYRSKNGYVFYPVE